MDALPERLTALATSSTPTSDASRQPMPKIWRAREQLQRSAGTRAAGQVAGADGGRCCCSARMPQLPHGALGKQLGTRMAQA